VAPAKKAPAKGKAKKAEAPAPAKAAEKKAKPARAPRAKKAAKAEPATEAPAAATAPEAKKPERHRRIFPHAVYEPNKDVVKAPLKDLGMKWQYLGQGKGRYAGEGVQAFVQYTDTGADFTVWGPDDAAVKKILDAWNAAFPAAESAAATQEKKEAEAAESEAMRLWRLAEPQRRPGEPEGFFRRRREEWERQKPGA
jgi:hypothetical protein